jgi:sugar phosphate isomerase/epimerase
MCSWIVSLGLPCAVNHFLLSSTRNGTLNRDSSDRHDRKESSMPQLKIGVEAAVLGVPLKRALYLAAEMGADAVEIDARGEASPARLSRTGLRQLRKTLEDHRMQVSAVTFRTRRGYDTPADLDRRVAATKTAMQFAYDLGCSVVINHVGRVPKDPESDARRLMVEVLSDLADHGLRVGAALAAETGTENGEDLAGLLSELPEQGIGVDLNPGNLIASGHSALEAISVLGPSIVHVHATDAVCDLARNRGEHGEHVPVGQGSVDFPGLLGALEEYGYRGYFTVGHQGTGDVAGAVGDVIRYLRGFY